MPHWRIWYSTSFQPVSLPLLLCSHVFLFWLCHIWLPLASKVHSNGRQSRSSMAQQTAGHSTGHGPNRYLLFCICPASVAFLLHRRVQSPQGGKCGVAQGLSNLQTPWTQLIPLGLLKPAVSFSASLITDLKQPLMFPTLYNVFKFLATKSILLSQQGPVLPVYLRTKYKLFLSSL